MLKFFIFVLLLGLLTTIAATTSSCAFPEFSHKNGLAMSWLTKRAKNHLHQLYDSKRAWSWSEYGKVKSDVAFGSANATFSLYEEFLHWVHNSKQNVSEYRSFFLVPNKMPKLRTGDFSIIRNYGQSSAAGRALKEGDSILDIPVKYCLSDEISTEDPATLNKAPWELRLTTKLLRERSKGKTSFWAPFIKLLPSVIASPLFFSDVELNDIEDISVINEIKLIRSFAEASFDALQGDETAGASSKEFAWALALIYTSACRLDDTGEISQVIYQASHYGLYSRLESSSDNSRSLHLLIPFFSADHGSQGQVLVQHNGGLLKLHVTREVKGGHLLRLQADEQISSAAFIYRGFVPRNLCCDRVKVFEDLEELIDWYFLMYGGINRNRYLTLKIAKQAVQALDSTFTKLSVDLFGEYHRGIRPLKADYSIGNDGYIDPYLMCILAALSEFDKILTIEGERYTPGFYLSPFSGAGRNWENQLQIIASDCLLLNESVTTGFRGLSHISQFMIRPLFTSALSVLKERLVKLLDSSSTLFLEEEALLEAVAWEGFSSESETQSCPTCKWHTDVFTVNANFALQLRHQRKSLLIRFLAMQSYTFDHVEMSSFNSKYQLIHSEHGGASVKKFLKWSEAQGSSFSEKIAVTYFGGRDDGSSVPESSHVRGVQALQDILPGETICVLPLNMGLFDNQTIGTCGVDNWHLAAARLIQERALGDNSKWAQYIDILPQRMATPINLDPHEIKEVQWWPAIRELTLVRKAIKESYYLLSGPLLAWAQYEDYRWASIMVHSRAFTLPVKDDEEFACYVLMPFMDMINHHYQYQADWMSLPVRGGRLEIIAKQHITKGEQIFASFGPRSNDNLFLYYGFVLENNPFDSSQIFTSFEEGVRWFMALWSSNCTSNYQNSAAEAFCNMCYWEQNWMHAKLAMDMYDSGVSGRSIEWWEYVTRLADYGYEYMQFQPGPFVYVGGVVDPNLLVAFEAAANQLDYSSIFIDDPYNLGAENSTMSSAVSIDLFFKCMELQVWPLSATLQNLVCWDHLVQALAAKQQQQDARAKFVAKLVVALRCLEILKTFPTTMEEDMNLLELRKGKTESHSLNVSPGSSSPSEHLHLTRKYRYMKKKMFRAHIDSFVQSS